MLKFLQEHKLFLVYLPLTVYWIVLFVATTLPTESLPSVSISDKLQHFGAYLVLAILFNLTISFQNKIKLIREKHYFFTIIIIGIYAAFDEIHQYFIPGRSCELADFIADMVGLLVGLSIVLLIRVFDSRLYNSKVEI